MNYRLLKACKLQKTDKIPIWLMRQVGRYLPEYREIRKKLDFKELCKDIKTVTELSVLPVEKFDLDAAILLSDILIPLDSVGFNLEIHEERGAVIKTISSKEEIKKLEQFNPENISFVYEAIREMKKILNKKVPIIGFSGAPFTYACYLIEGRYTRDFYRTKFIMYNEDEFWSELIQKLSSIVFIHVKEQVNSGADVIQIFDSWTGSLSPSDYKEYVLPYYKELFSKISMLNVPIIYFSTSSAGLCSLFREIGVHVVSVDWRIDIEEASKILGNKIGLQGNLDPSVLLSKKEKIAEKTKEILDKVGSRLGFIFNLGHGVLPETPIENVKFLVEYVHSYKCYES
jgi:uroporphyrinogen decarboxylase